LGERGRVRGNCIKGGFLVRACFGIPTETSPFFSWHSNKIDANFEEKELEKLKERIQQIKKKRPGYKEILDFYQKVREAQDKTKASLNIKPIKLRKEWKELLAKEGFSLIQKEDFPLDVEASTALFARLCQIAKEANPHMAEQVEKINEAITHQSIDLKKLLMGGVKEQKIEKVADKFGLDAKVFLFLIQGCTRPCIESGMEQLCSQLDPENWLKGYCPMCGSLPSLSLLKGEEGKRYLLCSCCGYQWRIDRLICPFCNNKEQQFLQYFCGKGEEAYRIDLCDKCHQYIKTIDYRTLEESDPVLEDLATLHLDILAIQKGYQRPVPNPWTT
jgi:FdhE protein